MEDTMQDSWKDKGCYKTITIGIECFWCSIVLRNDENMINGGIQLVFKLNIVLN